MNMEQHKCKLPRAEIRVVNYVIETGLCIVVRRAIASFVMINEKHPLCMAYYRSRASRRKQELKHMALYFPPMIHPLSMMALYWEYLMLLIYLMLFDMQIFFALEQEEKDRYTLRCVRFSFDLVFIVDMLKTFITGYYDMERSRTVLKSWEVAKRYLKGFFVLDLICCGYCITVIIQSMTLDNGFIETSYSSILELTVFLRLFHLRRVSKAIQLFCLQMKIKSIYTNAAITIITFVLIAVMFMAVVIEVEFYIDKKYDILIYDEPRKVKALFSALVILLLTNAGRKSFDVTSKKLITIIFMLLGFVIHCFLFAEIMKVWKKYNTTQNRTEGLFRQFKELMIYKGLPINLRDKISSYFVFKYQNQLYDEVHLHKLMSKLLRQEVLMNITKHHVEKAQFFQNLPPAILYRLVSRLKSVIYLTNDIVIEAGTRGDCMYFIYFGTVAIYSPAGLEICHLDDGSHFGEIALVFNEPRVATVVAITPCELFLLYRKDFLEVLEPFESIKNKIYVLAAERMRASALAKKATDEMIEIGQDGTPKDGSDTDEDTDERRKDLNTRPYLDVV